MELTEHPLRRELVREMHLRRFAPVAAPATIVQTVIMLEEGQRGEETTRLSALAKKYDFELQPEARHAFIPLDDGLCFLWERHTEATTLTIIAEARSGTASEHSVGLLEGWPGMVARATKIYVEKDETEAQNRLEAMNFEAGDLICCEVNAGVTIWSERSPKAPASSRPERRSQKRESAPYAPHICTRLDAAQAL